MVKLVDKNRKKLTLKVTILDREYDRWTLLNVRQSQWRDEKVQRYQFKVSILLGGQELNSICQTSYLTDVKNHCEEWTDPEEPSYLIVFSCEEAWDTDDYFDINGYRAMLDYNA